MSSLFTTLQQARHYVGPSQVGRRMCYCPRCKRKARIPEGAEVCFACTRQDIDRALREHVLADRRRS